MSDLRMELIQGQLNDIEENVRSIKATWGNTIMTLDNIKSSLKADRQKAIDEAYQKGLEEGKKQAKVQAHLDVCHDIERVAHGNYQKGLNDAWECARKIVTWPDRSLVNSDTFDLDPGENIFTKYSASRAIALLREYEEQQKDEIKVGDEVTPKSNDSNWLGVVVGVDDTNAMVMTRDGYTAMYRLEILKKTDKHFPQVAELFKAMKDEQRNCSTCKHQLVNSIECVDCCGYKKYEPKEGAE